LPVVGAIAPPAETSHRPLDPEIEASLTTKGGSALGPAEFALARPRRMATVLAFASFDRHAGGCDLPAKGSARRRASRARGPSAPLAERARDRCCRSLALPVGKQAPLANAPTFARASAPEGATCLPRARVRPTSGLGMRGRLDPKRLALRYRARLAACGCHSRDRRSGT